MSDENVAPVDEQDQPNDAEASETTEAPNYFGENFDPSTLDEALRPAYKQMHADYTRKTQTLAEQRKQHEQDIEVLEALRNDPNTQQQVFAELAEALGYDLDDEDDADEFFEGLEGDDESPVDPRVEELWQEREQALQDAELDALEDQINSAIARVGKVDGREFTDEERDILFAHVLSLPPKGDQPDVEAAYKHLKAAEEAAIKRYVDAKNAPSPPPQGSSGSPDIDINDSKARKARMAAILAGQQG